MKEHLKKTVMTKECIGKQNYMYRVFKKLSSLTIFQSLFLLIVIFKIFYFNACEAYLVDIKVSFCNLEVTSYLTLNVIVSIWKTKEAGLNYHDIACSAAFCYKGWGICYCCNLRIFLIWAVAFCNEWKLLVCSL